MTTVGAICLLLAFLSVVGLFWYSVYVDHVQIMAGKRKVLCDTCDTEG